MCRFCAPLLGSDVLPHKEVDCPLRKSAYCAYCSSYGHFQSSCSRKATVKVIDTVPGETPGKPRNVLFLTDTVPVHRAYLSTHGHVIYGKEAKNKEACLGIAKQLGYEGIEWLHGKKVKKVPK